MPCPAQIRLLDAMCPSGWNAQEGDRRRRRCAPDPHMGWLPHQTHTHTDTYTRIRNNAQQLWRPPSALEGEFPCLEGPGDPQQKIDLGRSTLSASSACWENVARTAGSSLRQFWPSLSALPLLENLVDLLFASKPSLTDSAGKLRVDGAAPKLSTSSWTFK